MGGNAGAALTNDGKVLLWGDADRGGSQNNKLDKQMILTTFVTPNNKIKTDKQCFDLILLNTFRSWISYSSRYEFHFSTITETLKKKRNVKKIKNRRLL